MQIGSLSKETDPHSPRLMDPSFYLAVEPQDTVCFGHGDILNPEEIGRHGVTGVSDEKGIISGEILIIEYK